MDLSPASEHVCAPVYGDKVAEGVTFGQDRLPPLDRGGTLAENPQERGKRKRANRPPPTFNQESSRGDSAVRMQSPRSPSGLSPAPLHKHPARLVLGQRKDFSHLASRHRGEYARTAQPRCMGLLSDLLAVPGIERCRGALHHSPDSVVVPHRGVCDPATLSLSPGVAGDWLNRSRCTTLVSPYEAPRRGLRHPPRDRRREYRWRLLPSTQVAAPPRGDSPLRATLTMQTGIHNRRAGLQQVSRTCPTLGDVAGGRSYERLGDSIWPAW